jgi:TetR/AcrR family transcriptional repressor of nem operon
MPRCKNFDPDEALAKATEVFWSKGYEATSVQDLVDAMGINRCSLYDTFGDKHSLFLAALDRYGSEVAGKGFEDLAAAEDGAEAIRSLFLNQVESFVADGPIRGCFLANSAAELAARDDAAAERVRRGLARAEGAFRLALGKAEAAGDLAPGRNLDDLARFFVTSMNGLAVVAQAKPGRPLLESTAQIILAALDGP